MFERFARGARTVAAHACDEARLAGSATVDGEHLLLALARDEGGVAGAALARAGLSHADIRAALDRELEHSLAAVGVVLEPEDLPGPPAGPAPRPRWGGSARAALEGALTIAAQRGDRRIGPEHILLALLRARAGTVPRALAQAGVDPDDLAADLAVRLA